MKSAIAFLASIVLLTQGRPLTTISDSTSLPEEHVIYPTWQPTVYMDNGIAHNCGTDMKVYTYDESKGTCGETCMNSYFLKIGLAVDSSLIVASRPD